MYYITCSCAQTAAFVLRPDCMSQVQQCAAGSTAVGDVLLLSAWLEQAFEGASSCTGWGVGLHTQPDAHGQELGVVLARASQEVLPGR